MRNHFTIIIKDILTPSGTLGSVYMTRYQDSGQPILGKASYYCRKLMVVFWLSSSEQI